MGTLTVRNVDDEVMRRLRIRAAEHGRSAEAEHREILKAALVGDRDEALRRRYQAAQRLAEFRAHNPGGQQPAAELLRDMRLARMRELLGEDAVPDELF
jgi:plasmid stability protein